MIGRVVLITGAAGDIGSATAHRLAADGWTVALTDHPAAAEGLDRVAQSLPGRAWSARCDITDDSSVAGLIEACIAEVGTPDGLFNNAGYQGRFDTLPNVSIDDARAVFEVNVLGAMRVLQYTAQAMVKGGRRGSIVNMASMAGVGGAPNMAAYSASKAAVIGLTRTAAKDLAPHGVRVNAVSPAFIGPGKMWDNQVAQQAGAGSQYYSTEPAEVARQMIGMVPLRRYGSTGEVAAVVAFLLGDDASYVTGQNLEITGGSV